MASFNLNQTIKNLQKRNLMLFIAGLLLVVLMMGLLISGGPKSTSKPLDEKADLVGVIDENFSDANTVSALTSQQAELDSLKSQIKLLQESMAKSEKEHMVATNNLSKQLKETLSNPKRVENQGVLVAENNSGIQPSWQERLAQKYQFPSTSYSKPCTHDT